MIARQSNWMPPMNRITRMSVVKPFGTTPGERQAQHDLGDDRDERQRRRSTARATVMKSSGAYENEKIALRAQPRFRSSELVDVPNMPLRPDVRHAGLLEADPGAQAAQEAVDLGQRSSARPRRGDRAARSRRRPAGPTRTTSTGRRGRRACTRTCSVQRRLALDALPVDDVVARLPLRGELLDQLRRVLQVAVEQHHGVAGGDAHAAGEGALRAEVPRVVDDDDMRVARRQLGEDLLRVVRAAVVDEDDLVARRRASGRRPSAARASAAPPARRGSRR